VLLELVGQLLGVVDALLDRDEGGDGLPLDLVVDAPTTADSATLGWSTSALSTSMVPMRWPATFSTSSTRPSSQ
jgi:hypothetical protein